MNRHLVADAQLAICRDRRQVGADPQIFLCIFVYALISYQSSMGDESVCSDAVEDWHTYLPGCAEMTALGKQENDFLPLSKPAKYVHRNHCVSLEAGKAI